MILMHATIVSNYKSIFISIWERDHKCFEKPLLTVTAFVD